MQHRLTLAHLTQAAVDGLVPVLHERIHQFETIIELVAIVRTFQERSPYKCFRARQSRLHAIPAIRRRSKREDFLYISGLEYAVLSAVKTGKAIRTCPFSPVR